MIWICFCTKLFYGLVKKKQYTVERKKNRAAAMAPRNDDRKVLNFGGVTLRRSDVERLKNPEDLNDLIIQFIFEYLTLQVNDSMKRTTPPLLLVGPAQTYWLLHCPSDTLQDSIKPLSMPEREMVIFALNDNPDPTAPEGGYHWSLIVYSRSHNAFEHYDSFKGGNERVAQAFVDRIGSYMGEGSSEATLNEPKTPQQRNGYDCGVYVMKTAQLLCNTFIQQQRAVVFADIVDPLRTQLTPASIEAMRASTVRLILDLSEQ